jgi:hypothetical protein
MSKSPLSDLLSAINVADSQSSASADGTGIQLAAHKILLEMATPELRSKYLDAFTKHQIGGLSLRDALQRGDVGIVTAYKELLALIPWNQRIALLK